MYDDVDVSHIDAHSQSHSDKNDPDNSIWSSKTVQYDLLVVLRSVGMKHAKKVSVTDFFSSRRLVRSITKFEVKMNIQIGTYIQCSTVNNNTWGLILQFLQGRHY